MASFLIGICAAGIIAGITFFGYAKYDISSGRPEERPAVKLDAPTTFSTTAQKNIRN